MENDVLAHHLVESDDLPHHRPWFPGRWNPKAPEPPSGLCFAGSFAFSRRLLRDSEATLIAAERTLMRNQIPKVRVPHQRV